MCSSDLGVNVTGMRYGEVNKTINFDSVQEVQILSTGLNAEYGRMTGGVINVVTKSGGNTFTGSAYGYYRGGGLVSSNTTGSLRALSATYVERRDRLREGAALAGAGKRAAFALFYGPLHYLLVRDIVRSLGAGQPRAGAAPPTSALSVSNFRSSTSSTFTAST